MNVNRASRMACGLAVVLLLGACGSAGDEDASGGKLAVVASTGVWAQVARTVGGDQVAVQAIIDSSTADPHSYRATARDAADVLDSDLVLYNGGGYDPFMTEILGEAQVPALNAYRLSGHGGHGGHGNGHADAHGHAHAGANEHVWYDPHAVARVADALAGKLAELRPAAKQAFLDNAAAFKTELQALADRIERIAADHAGTRVLATSPMSHYLLADAKLHSVTPAEFIEAVEEGSDIPILTQQHVRKLVSTGQVEVVIQNAQTVTPVVGKLVELARKQGVPVVAVTETLPADKDYIAWMNAQVQALAGALNRS